MKVKLINSSSGDIIFFQNLKFKDTSIEELSLKVYNTSDPCVLEKAYLVKKLVLQITAKLQNYSDLCGNQLVEICPCIDLGKNNISLNDKILISEK